MRAVKCSCTACFCEARGMWLSRLAHPAQFDLPQILYSQSEIWYNLRHETIVRNSCSRTGICRYRRDKH